MGTIGGLREFSMTDDFEVWHKQFEAYIAANDVLEERLVALFLTLIGTEGYKFLRNLCAPARPREMSVRELVLLISNHLKLASLQRDLSLKNVSRKPVRQSMLTWLT